MKEDRTESFFGRELCSYCKNVSHTFRQCPLDVQLLNRYEVSEICKRCGGCDFDYKHDDH
jgi:hypothetical protein